MFLSGHYVPQLAKLMIEANKKEKIFNLKGIAVSNTYIHTHSFTSLNKFGFNLTL